MESVKGSERWNGIFRRARRPFASAMRNAFANFHRGVKPAAGHDLFSAKPLDREFGLRRGTPVDRYYIERFLDTRRKDITGRVLEFGSRAYTEKFGSATRSDVLHADDGNREATIFGDLVTGRGLENRSFDAIICTQTLPFVTDAAAAVKTLHHCLEHRGVLLVTVPCITQISRYDMSRWGDYWRFTSLGLRTLLAGHFSTIEITAFGNLFAATALLHGMAAEECEQARLDAVDADYEVVICARAVRS